MMISKTSTVKYTWGKRLQVIKFTSILLINYSLSKGDFYEYR